MLALTLLSLLSTLLMYAYLVPLVVGNAYPMVRTPPSPPSRKILPPLFFKHFPRFFDSDHIIQSLLMAPKQDFVLSPDRGSDSGCEVNEAHVVLVSSRAATGGHDDCGS